MYLNAIKTMIDLTDAINVTIANKITLPSPEWLTSGVNWVLATNVEIYETVDSVGWKWWADQPRNQTKMEMELVGIFYFLLSYQLTSSVPKSGVIDRISLKDTLTNALYVDYKSEEAKSGKLLKSTQTKDAIVASLEWLAYVNMRKENHAIIIPAFFKVMFSVGTDIVTFTNRFIGKIALEMIRHTKGYYDGTYDAVWANTDIDILYGILATYDVALHGQDLYGYVLSELEAAYPI